MPTHLIDVRSAPEFSSPPPQNPLPGAINIEFTSISSITTVIPEISPTTDDVVLYCRSGRRSAVAMEELMALGFARVRDLGDLEGARRVWEGEKRERLAGYAGEDGKEKETGCQGGCGHGHGHSHGVSVGVERDTLERSHKALMDGLRAAE